jgi:hypothetical protein
LDSESSFFCPSQAFVEAIEHELPIGFRVRVVESHRAHFRDSYILCRYSNTQSCLVTIVKERRFFGGDDSRGDGNQGRLIVHSPVAIGD